MSNLRQGIKTLFARDQTDQSYFDRKFYVSAYPDIAASGADGYTHFMTYGWREGRNPSRDFNTLYYRDHHLEGADINPLTHYRSMGGKQSSIVTTPDEAAFVALQRYVIDGLFDDYFYRTQVGTISQDPLSHYLDVGWKAGRAPNPFFDGARYCAENAFVEALGVCPFYHFASQSRMWARDLTAQRERWSRVLAARTEALRSPSILVYFKSVIEPEFDRRFYLRHNTDVRAAGMDPLDHFLLYGAEERRDPNAFFDCKYYISQNHLGGLYRTNPFYHYLTIGRAEGLRPNPIGTQGHPPLLEPLPSAWGKAAKAAASDVAQCIVIMPVHSGHDQTLAAIHAILANPQKTPFALHVIGDATPDADLDAALRRLANQGFFAYTRNAKAVGFVKSANRGLRSYPDKDVILVNADTLVFGDWLDRILAHARRDPAIATITPLSNDARDCGYPVSDGSNAIALECSSEALDRLAAECNAGRNADILAGSGVCLFISRASRAALGLFDEDAFTPGYGEDEDFCLRAVKKGFRNVLAADVFVYHEGEVSFAERAGTLAGQGRDALIRKHPDYPLLRTMYADSNGPVWGRVRLDLWRMARASAGKAVVCLYPAGDPAIETRIGPIERGLRETGIDVVHLCVGGLDRATVSIRSGSETAPYCPNVLALPFHRTKDVLGDFLALLAPRAIHIHSFAGFDWRATADLMDLIERSAIPYFYTLHDYSALCHRNTLVLTNGRFCGLPDVTACRVCVKDDRAYPEAIDPAVLRERYGAFLKEAAGVFAPSQDIKARFESRDVAFPITVRADDEPWALTRVLRRARSGPAIDVVTVGSFDAGRGSHLVLALARDAQARALPIRFHIIGPCDVTGELGEAGATVTGPYRDLNDVFDHIERLRPACIFVPSIWPDPHGASVSIACLVEIPPVVFDLGASAERVRATNFGFVLPYGLIDDIEALNDQLCALSYQDQVLDARHRAVKPFPS